MEELPTIQEVDDSTLKAPLLSTESASDTKTDTTLSIDEELLEKYGEDLRSERVANVFLPASYVLDDKILRDQKKNCFDSDVIRIHFFNQGKLSESQASKITKAFIEMVKKEPNVIYVDKPCTIFGDIHGQYYDLLKIIKNINFDHETVVFVGDYVDRGSFSSEVFLFLMALKLAYPKNVILLRGNHESSEMTRYFSFKKECDIKYSNNMYKEFLSAFRALPLCAVVMKKIFCVHGGISPDLKEIEDINRFNRFVEPTSNKTMLDLLWADPHPFYESLETVYFAPNKNRRCSYFYTYLAVKEFLAANNLWCIVRGHEVQENGYKLYKEYIDDVPSVITIFSAPNYCDVYKNRGAVIKFDGEHIQIKKFKEDEHPFILPGFIDAFNWTFPFISTKIGELLLDLLSVKPSTSSSSSVSGIDENIKQVQTFTTAMSLLREEREGMNEFVDEESTDLSTENIKGVVVNEDDNFTEVKIKDIPNEVFKTKDNLTKSMSIETVPSFAKDISKEVENADLNAVVEESKIVETESKSVKVVVPENPKKKPSLFSCCFKKD
ncbi:Serine-threonine phosphatase 2B, catalytic subunit [Trachipleistophora hominis]|uniref:Serine/threonine-protein phosphatase n=1 Tax=Trachipleistophora hominis TaxID=72359 RepID=L7JTM2_TRAHO|nr:Serine-threonine phosphatase 2B, catalytic subunit [Trachipleistophora hominis]